MNGYCPLASGSKGNCIYFGTKQTKILIDAGISGKATAQRLAAIDVDLSEIDAILITHEHIDHIKGLYALACKMGIPVFANSDTAKGIVSLLKECPKFKIFSTGETFEFGDIEIHPFTIQHDTLHRRIHNPRRRDEIRLLHRSRFCHFPCCGSIAGLRLPLHRRLVIGFDVKAIAILQLTHNKGSDKTEICAKA